MLPSQPKIFHGRDSELSNILQLFSQGKPRIAILGAGGMGKTSLARAVIHHTEITERYNQHRFFIACDLAATQVELAGLIGAHVGLKPGKDLTHPVIQYFSSSSDCLLILDNLETLWEPAESRGKIEEFLSLLTGVDHLALLVGLQRFFTRTFNLWCSDHNERSRKTSKSGMDSPISATVEALGASCSTTNIYRYCRQYT
jgi:GTPase SAR1 family protein